MGGAGGRVSAMVWPHIFMKSEAENTSPRTWAQLRPTDVPPHLKFVTFHTSNKNGKLVGGANFHFLCTITFKANGWEHHQFLITFKANSNGIRADPQSRCEGLFRLAP